MNADIEKFEREKFQREEKERLAKLKQTNPDGYQIELDKGKTDMFSNVFSFNGRIRRTEYVISFVAYIIITNIVNEVVKSGSMVFSLANIPLLWFLWAQGAKRCHDLGNSGWWQIIPFYVFWLLFQEGKPGMNEFGLNPKGYNLK